MDELEVQTKRLIYELLTKSPEEIPAIIKAKRLEDSIDYILTQLNCLLSETREKFELIFAHNPHQRPSFVEDHVRSSGYPWLIAVFELMHRQRYAKEQETEYWRKVDRDFDLQKEQFERTYNNSSAKDALVRREIQSYERLFDLELLPIKQINNIDTPIDGLRYRAFEIVTIRKLYDKLIVRGEREYHLTAVPGSPIVFTGAADTFHIKAEVHYKYLGWLKDFQQKKDLSSDTLISAILRDLGTVRITSSDAESLKAIDPDQLNTYLSKYYQVSEEVKVSRDLANIIFQLKTLVFFYKERAREPLVTDISKKGENGEWQFGWIVRKTEIDKWIKEKIVLPLEDKISRLSELQSILTSTTPGDTQQQKPKKEKGFEAHLIGNGRRVVSYLRSHYESSKPIVIAYMLKALAELKFLKAGSLANQVELHRALTTTFGKVGTRQSLSANLSKLQDPGDYHRAQIDTHKKEIKAATSS